VPYGSQNRSGGFLTGKIPDARARVCVCVCVQALILSSFLQRICTEYKCFICANIYKIILIYIYIYATRICFSGLELACWPLVPKFVGSNPAKAVGFLRTKKSSFGGEVKSVSYLRFAACKSSLELRGNRILGQICRNISRPRRVPPSAAGGLSRRWM
jgi:hypothetical protein